MTRERGERRETKDLVLREIPAEVHRRIKVEAAWAGVSVKAWVLRVVEEALGGWEGEGVRERVVGEPGGEVNEGTVIWTRGREGGEG